MKALVIQKDLYYFLSPYGIGDTMILCGYKPALERKLHGQIHLLLKPSQEIVAKMYGMADYTVVNCSVEDYERLGKAISKPTQGRVFVAHPDFVKRGRSPLKKFQELEIRFLDLYRGFLELPAHAEIEQPRCMPSLPEALRQKVEAIAPLDKTVLICPEANSMNMLPHKFWEKLIEEFKADGLSVLCNAVDPANIIHGSHYMPLSLEESVALGLACKKVHSLRSGFCDLINSKGEDLTTYYYDSRTKYLYDLNLLHNRTDINQPLLDLTDLPSAPSPLVTIITPVHNLLEAGRKEMFQQCVESVRHQTYSHIEHLVIDGGSTDGSIDLLEKYRADGWIKYLSSPDNGIYDAMNKGVAAASGKYIAFLNSDDFYHNTGAVKHSVDALEESGADFSFGTVKMIKYANSGSLMFYPDERMFIYKMPFSHQSMFCNKSIFLKERFDTNFKLAADFDWIIRLYLSGYTSIRVDEQIATYRMNGVSGLNVDSCLKEYAKVYRKNYSRYGAFSDAVFERMAVAHVVPSSLLRAIKKNHKKLFARIFEPSRISCYFFGILIYSIIGSYSVSRVLLFGFIPLLKIIDSPSVKKIRLFNVISFIRIRRR